MQHYQLEHEFLKKKRFNFELNHLNQLNAIKENQVALDQSMQETRKLVLEKLEDARNPIDPKTEKAINDLRKISFNHLAPLIDNLLNLSKENEQLLQQLELNRSEVYKQRNKAIAQESNSPN